MLRAAITLVAISVVSISAIMVVRSRFAPEVAPLPPQGMRAEQVAAAAEDSQTANDPTGQTPEHNYTLAEALALAESGMKNLHQNVTDYTARFLKQERVDGKLTEPNEMIIKVQNPGRDADGKPLRPMRVYLKFVLPTNTAGREVIWCQDKFDGNLVAHEAGMLNLLRVKLDPRGAIAMMGNRYPIENIGLAFLTEELLRRGRGAPDDADLQVSMRDGHQVGEKTCRLIRIECPTRDAGLGFARIDIAVDEEHLIPLHYSSYDWGAKPGEEPILLESYTYYDVVLNPGLTDADFDPDNPDYAYP